MNEELKTFIRTYLDLEQAYDTSGLRPTLMAFSESYVQAVREGFSEVLQKRNLSLGEYEGMTGLEFPDIDSLYEYLQDMNAYLFEGRPDQPAPPEDVS
ncbi:hypothetical protein [Streptomyces alboflavus]|uniref:hypothetical protein n=1 Tax=Streptomyces alboflavus TaxID=67267 RepID=UPI000F657C84|nr:hypothetical protein [Streptomyces alboflavus]